MPPRKGNRKHKKSLKLTKKSLKSMMKSVAYSTQETLHHRVFGVDQAVPRVGYYEELNTVDQQGVQSGNFTGQEIRQMGLRLKGRLLQADSSNIVRWCVVTFTSAFQELLRDGTAEVNELFYEPSGALYSPMRECNIKKVYLDKTVVLNQQDSENNKIVLFNEWIPLGFKKYKAIEAGPTTVDSGSDIIYIIALSDSSISPSPLVTYHSTLYYKDA